MVVKAYYKDRFGDYRKISSWALQKLHETDPAEYLYIKERIVRFPFDRYPVQMTFYENVPHPHFRRKASRSKGGGCSWRGEGESLTHLCNILALSKLREFSIGYRGNAIKVYVSSVEEYGYRVECNGRTYIPDICFHVARTEPAEYAALWKNKLFVEIYHTCKVDSKQAEDFFIENLPLFEHKIKKYSYMVPDELSEEDEIKVVERLKKQYANETIYGNMICPVNDLRLSGWHLSQNGNYTCKQKDVWFTVFSAIEDGKTYYKIAISEKGKEKTSYINEYNGRRCESIEAAIKLADYLCFRLFNGEKLSKIV